MKQVLGTELAPVEQRKALELFVWRHTGDHAPPYGDSHQYPVQFIDDNDWLAHTRFWIRDNGVLSRRHRYCECNPTWPNNPELRRV